MPGSGLEIRVLGRFEVVIDGRPVEISSGRLCVLLATLAMSAGEVVSAERLSAALWAGRPPAQERRGLQTAISRLRGLLGAAAVARGAGGYALRCRREQIDALRFAELVATAPGDEGERIRLSQAHSLWRGTPFQGVYSAHLVKFELPRLTEAYLALLDRRADFDIADGRYAEAAADLRLACSEQPLRETTWARWILALARSGRREEALHRYEEISARMADQLGADPGPELRAARAELLSAAEPDLISTSRGAAVPRQLPADIARLVGRGEELVQMDGALAGSVPTEPTIVVLHGTGGVGKTALAVKWAHQSARWFPDGQVYIDLRGHVLGAQPRTAVEALDLLLRGFGFDGNLVSSDLDGLSALWRTVLATRDVLVILDDARDADHLRPLLPDRGGGMVVVTGRSRLRSLSGRVERISLDRLTSVASEELLARNLEAEGLSWSAAAIAELAELCDGLPLALAIASERAVRNPSASQDELFERLREEPHRLDALEIGDDPLASVRAVLTASYDVLDSESARTYRLLGSYPGAELGVAAAAELTGTTRATVRRLLGRLEDLHLVRQREPDRYTMHDLVRIHALEQSTTRSGRG
ncbi:BTAD domain-containing putative transcriptional regulator [Kribbella sp. NPDC003505]|uniref:AfsR/SARP family transcriptional regulator n=1 Tax=Kribbella sp. NPDC003505 TaxID=3154448 RepID=UPI0033BA700F